MRTPLLLSGNKGFATLFALFLLLTNISLSQTISVGLGTRSALSPSWLGYNGQNTIRNGESWVEPNLKANVPLLKPKVLRYPAGGIGNWWDWKKGWFVTSPNLPPNYAVLPQQPNTLENFKIVKDSCHADAVFMLNMVSSNLQYQIAMLKHADSIGMPVKFVELGNEFFISADDEDAGEGAVYVDSLFKFVKNYTDVANIWIDSIHHYFPSCKVAIQGCFEKNKKPKRLKWNDSINVLINHREDAWSFHTYYSSAWNDTLETTADKIIETIDEVPNWLYQPFKMWKVLSSTSISKVPVGKDLWNTEFNMTDHARPVHGLWGHGIYLALQSMQFLNDSRFKVLTCHAMDGSALYGQYFFVTNGFNFGGDDGSWTAPPNPPSTTFWGLTATGVTMKLLGESVSDKTYASKLVFTPNPQITTVEDYGLNSYSYDRVYGWLFNNAAGSDAIILNLTDSVYNLTTTVLYPSGGTYKQKYTDVLKPIGNSTTDVTELSGTLPATLLLPAYSITKINSSFVPAVPPTANITVNGASTICQGDSVQLDAGSGYVSYVWSTGATTRTIYAKATGDYWVHAYAVAGGYYGTATVHITVNPLPNRPNAVPAGSRFFCDGDSVQLNLQIVNPPTGLTYLWQNGKTTSSIYAKLNGNYWVTITDLNGCKSVSDTEAITVYQLPHPTITASGATEFCYDQSVTLSAPYGYSNYTWSPSGFGQTKIVSTSGTYFVTVTDVNGCIGQSANSIPVTVYDLPTPTIVMNGGGTTFCAGSPVYMSTQAGYTYQWQQNSINIAGATLQNYTPATGGPYKVATTESHGCSRTSTPTNITINPIPTPNISSSNGTIFCNGSSTVLSIATSYYTYLWSTGSTSPTITVTTSGSYTATITDGNGCVGTSAAKTITVNQNPVPVISAASATDFCSGGSVVLSVTQVFNSYNWSNGTFGQSKTVTTSGNYSCTVTDANSCTGTSNTITVNSWNLPDATITVNGGGTTFCAGSGVYLSAVAGYGYQWQLGGVDVVGATAQTYYPTATANYKVVVTDLVHGCTKKTEAATVITVNPLPSPSITSSLGSSFCSGNSTVLSVNNTYNTYLWSTSAITSTITSTSSGTYTVTVTDANGCAGVSAGKLITVNPLPTPTISASSSPDICSGSSVTLSVTQTYSSYLWSNGTVGQTKSISTAGTYYCTVTDANGCTGISNSITVTVHTPITPIVTCSGPTTFCDNAGVYLTTAAGYSYQWSKGGVDLSGANGQNYYPTVTSTKYKVRTTDQWSCTAESANFSVTVNASPVALILVSGAGTSLCGTQTATLTSSGIGTSYLWSNGFTVSSITTSVLGTYTLTVTKSNGCSAVSPSVILVKGSANVSISSSGPTEFCTGSTVLSTNTSFSSYSWSTGATTSTITVSNSGTYTCSVTDVNGCTGTSNSIIITSGVLTTPVISTSNGQTSFCSNSGVYLTTTTTGVTYQWYNGSTLISGATNQFHTPLSSGTYNLHISNTSGCTAVSASMTITVNSLPVSSITITGNTSICGGQTTTLSSTNSATTYLWSTGATTSSILVSTPGTYTLTVSNSLGCTSVSSPVTISAASSVAVTITASGATTLCPGGTINLSTSLVFYSYLWSNGSTGQSITVSNPGSYYCTVTDVGGCTGVSNAISITVSSITTPLVNTSSETTTWCEGAGNYLTTTSTGYNYQWFNGTTIISGATNQNYTPLTSGSYSLTISDASSCALSSAALSITVNPKPVAGINNLGNSFLCGGQTTELSSNGVFSSYLWSTGATTSSIIVATYGSYILTVTNSNGCSGTSSPVVISTGSSVPVTINPSGSTQLCPGGSVNLTTNTTFYSYLWSNGSTAASLSVTIAGTYYCTVTDVSGCTGISNSVVVSVSSITVPDISSSSGTNTWCEGTGNYLTTTTTGYNYQWYNGTSLISLATNQNYTPTSSGTYSLTISDATGCTKASASLVITINTKPVSSITVTGNTTLCSGQTATLSSNGTFSSYLWSTGATASSIVVSSTGTYTLTVTNSSGCTGVSSPVSITVNAAPVVTITAATATQFCTGGSVALSTSVPFTSYSWSNGSTTQSVTITTTGTYTCTATNSSGCTGVSNSIAVTVGSIPTPDIKTTTGATTYCSNAGVALTTSYTGYVYSWFKGSTLQNGQTGITYSPTVSGTYKVQIADNGGCTKKSAAITIVINTPPSPTITGSTTICGGAAVTLSSGATYSSYQWSTGATASSITTSTAGTYTLTVTDANGCTGVAPSKTTSAFANPVSAITASGATQFCDGGTVDLTASTASSYSWSNGKTTQAITVTATGTFTVTVTDANGCTGVSSAVPVTATILPIPDVKTSTGATTYCSNSGVYLTTSYTGYNYLWFKGTVAQSTETGITYTPTLSATYKVQISDAGGCTKQSSGLVITINTAPSPTINGTTTICGGVPVTLSSSGTYTSYLWSTGATASSVSISTGGTYTLTVTDLNGCTGVTPSKTTVSYASPASTITASGATDFCDGGNVDLTASAASTYLWSNSKTTQTINITATGTFTVTVTDANGCTAASASKTINEWIPPTPTVTCIGPTTYCSSTPSTLSTTTLTGYTYQWQKGTADLSGATNTTYIATVTGTYKVRITDTHGCSKTSTGLKVTVNTCKIENEFVDENRTASINVFPNPSSNQTQIEAYFSSSNDGEVVIEIFNTLGQLVYRDEKDIAAGVFSSQIIFDQRFVDGSYLIRLRFGNEILKQKLLIVDSNR